MRIGDANRNGSDDLHTSAFSTSNVMTLWELIRKPAFFVSEDVLDTIDTRSAFLVKRGEDWANNGRDLLVRGFMWGGHFYSVMRVLRPDEIVAVVEFVGNEEPEMHTPMVHLHGIFVNRDDDVSIETGPFKVKGDLGLKGRMQSYLLTPESAEGKETVRDIAEKLVDGAGRILDALGYQPKQDGIREMAHMSPEGKITFGFTFLREAPGPAFNVSARR